MFCHLLKSIFKKRKVHSSSVPAFQLIMDNAAFFQQVYSLGYQLLGRLAVKAQAPLAAAEQFHIHKPLGMNTVAWGKAFHGVKTVHSNKANAKVG